MQDLGFQRDLARLGLFGEVDCRVDRRVEYLALAFAVCLLIGTVVDPFEHARHSEHPCGTNHLEFLEEHRYAVGIVDLGALVDRGDLDHPGEDVSER